MLGDIIILKMRGTTQDGDPVEVTLPETPINNLPHTYELTLLNADVRKLAKTQFIFSYELKRNGSIRIPFDALIVVGMAIELKWFGTRPDSSTYDPELDWFFPNSDEVGDPAGFFISVEGKHLKTLEGGTLDLSYNLLSDEDGIIVSRGSRHAPVLKVGEPQFELVKPIVLGEKDSALEPNDLPNGASKLTAPRPTAIPTQAKDVVTYTWLGEVTGKKEDSITLNALSKDNCPENAGDHFYMKWISNDGVVDESYDKPISGNNKGKPVEFPVEQSFVLASLNKTVTISYWVELFKGGKAEAEDYELRVESQAFKLPVATFKESTGAQKDQLNPDDVYPNGATVIIEATSQLKTDDVVTVTVVGKTTTEYPHTVLSTEQDKELSSIKVLHAVTEANIDASISLSYTVKRKAGGTDGPSDSTVYDLRKVIGSGTLKVMGARYNRST